MNTETDITQSTKTPVLQRRNVLALAAASFCIAGHAPASCQWDGDGEYEVAASEKGPAGVYHISRYYCDMDKAWLLFGAYVFEGYRVAPRVIVDPSLILRKVGEVFS